MESNNTFMIDKAFHCCSSPTYEIKDETGLVILNTEANQSCCCSREQKIDVRNLNEELLFAAEHQTNCCAPSELEVTNGSSSIIGIVKPDRGFYCGLRFIVCNPSGDLLFTIVEQSSCCSCSNREFEVLTHDNEAIGMIKIGTGCGKFSSILSFEKPIDQKSKMLLLSSIFFIVSLIEDNNTNRSHHG